MLHECNAVEFIAVSLPGHAWSSAYMGLQRDSNIQLYSYCSCEVMCRAGFGEYLAAPVHIWAGSQDRF